MIVNPVVYGAGEGKEPVFEQVSSSNYQESNYTMSITLSHPCKVLTGLSLCFSSVDNRETVAGQELGHYDTLCRSGEKILDRNHGTEEQRTVWGALMSTSGDWATELREKIDRVRHTN